MVRGLVAASVLAAVSLGFGGCSLRGHDFCAVEAPPNSIDRFIQFFACESDEFGTVLGPFANIQIRDNPTRSNTPVRFDASASSGSFIEVEPFQPPIGHADVVKYEWDLDGDRGNGFEVDSGEVPTTERSYPPGGLPGEGQVYEIRLRVTDGAGLQNVQTSNLVVRDPGEAVPPTAAFQYFPVNPRAGETVELDASDSSDPEGGQLTYDWDLNTDGNFETPAGNDPTIETTFSAPGAVDVTLRVTDPQGLSDPQTQRILVREGLGRRDRSARRAPGATPRGAGRPFTGKITNLRFEDTGTEPGREGTVMTAEDVQLGATMSLKFAEGNKRRVEVDWDGSFDLSVDLANDRRVAKGVAIAKLPAGRTCMRLGLKSGKGDTYRGKIRFLQKGRPKGSFKATTGEGKVEGRVEVPREAGGMLAKPCRGLGN